MSPHSVQTLLVTGANGYAAGHIIKLALENSYHVKGTVRSKSSVAKLEETFSQYGPMFSVSIVDDITKPESYEGALDSSVTGVIHTASPFMFEIADKKQDMLDPAINGAIAILEAVKRYGSSVRRVVTTSSFAANLDVTQEFRPGYIYTEEDWCPLTYEAGAAADWGAVSYIASKALSEKAMWDWMKTESPSFSHVVINPAWIFGPHVPPLASIDNLNQSTSQLWALMDADKIPTTDFAAFVDVRDVAKIHIAAFEHPEAAGHRFLVGSHFDYQSAADAAREELPELRSRIPEGTPGGGWEEAKSVYSLDASKAEKMLGIRYTPLNVSMRDSFLELLEAEKLTKGKVTAA